MAVTLVWRTDVHLSDHTPISRRDVWAETVFNKLVEVGEISRQVGALGVLDGGDFFDIKSPARNSHALVRKTVEVHRSYPCPVYANVGNHDCVYGDYGYLHQQPLGVLFEAGVFKRLYDDHEQVFCQGGVKVRVVGIPYHGTTYDLDRLARIQRKDEDYLVVVAHLLASPKVTTMFKSEDVLKYEYLDAYPGDLYCFGHWHKDQGITKTRKGKTIVNIGSLTRGSLSQDDLDRIPSVAVLRFTPEGLTVEKVPLTCKPAHEIFDLVAKETTNLREEGMAEFADHLKAVLTSGKGESLRDKVRSSPNVPEEVRERTLLYVEKAESERSRTWTKTT
jgi:DNA repair exonuclease SbcCD nuclease subunit